MAWRKKNDNDRADQVMDDRDLEIQELRRKIAALNEEIKEETEEPEPKEEINNESNQLTAQEVRDLVQSHLVRANELIKLI